VYIVIVSFSIGYTRLYQVNLDFIRIGWPNFYYKYLREEVIQWIFRTSRSNVSIVGIPSLSALGNKNNLRQEAILIILNAVPHAARKERHGRMETMETTATAIGMIATATDHHAKCFQWNALNAEKTLKYPLNLVVVGQCFAATATVKLDW